MRKIAFAFLLSLLSILPSCKGDKTNEGKDSTTTVSGANTLKKADSLLAVVQKEWKVYTDLDSMKYKDLKGVYFQLKNIASTDTKKLEFYEQKTKEYEGKDINLYMPNFINEFFTYDSLLMLHVKEVVAFSETTKGAENLAVLLQLNKSLLEEVDDNLFVSTQSHLDLAIAYYNEYLKAHPEVMKANPNHKTLPEFGSIDRTQLKPVL
jgi:hypothetical protein